MLCGSHGPGVFKGPRDPDPERRYRMFHAHDYLRSSADGVRWSNRERCGGIESNGDTHNNMLWAPDIKR